MIEIVCHMQFWDSKEGITDLEMRIWIVKYLRRVRPFSSSFDLDTFYGDHPSLLERQCQPVDLRVHHNDHMTGQTGRSHIDSIQHIVVDPAVSQLHFG